MKIIYGIYPTNCAIGTLISVCFGVCDRILFELAVKWWCARGRIDRSADLAFDRPTDLIVIEINSLRYVTRSICCFSNSHSFVLARSIYRKQRVQLKCGCMLWVQSLFFIEIVSKKILIAWNSVQFSDYAHHILIEVKFPNTLSSHTE